jgi:periplasmic protein TonB
MFADSLLETSWAQRGRRSWTTLTSFGLQAVAIGLLLIIPILQTVGLPLARTVSTPISMGRPSTAPPHSTEHFRSSAVQIVPYDGRLRFPGHIPDKVSQSEDAITSQPSIGDVIGSTAGNSFDAGGLHIPFGGTNAVMPKPAPLPVAHTLRISSMLPGSLIHRVEPAYPPMARTAHIQGPVVLAAVISKTGTIENLRLLSGHPLLVPSAIQAVSQWRYKPYILNNEAVEVETQITVNFVLAAN